MRGCAIYLNFSFFPPYSKHREYILSELQTVEKVEKQLLKEPNSVQMIDARAAKLSDYNYPLGLMHITSQFFSSSTVYSMKARLGGIA